MVEFLCGSLAASPHRAGKPLRPGLERLRSTRRSDYRVITASTISAAESTSWPSNTAPAFTGHDCCEHHLSPRRLTGPQDMAAICAW